MTLLPKEVRNLIRNDKRWVWLLLGIASLVAFLEGAELIGLFFLGKALLGNSITNVTGGAIFERYLGGYSQSKLLVILGAAFAVVVMLRFGFSLVYRYLAYRWSSMATARLHKGVIESFVLAPAREFDKRKLGDIIHGSMEAPIGATYAIDGITALITSVFTVSLIIVVLVYVSPWLLLAAAGIILPILLIVAGPSHWRMQRLQQRIIERRTRATEVSANVINGIRDIKALSTERQVTTSFSHEMDLWESNFTQIRFAMFFPGPALQAVIQLAFAGAVVLMASLMSTEDLTKQLPTLGVLGYSLFRSYPALTQLSRSWMDLNRALPSLRRTAEWTGLPQDELAGGTQQPPGHFKFIRFQEVSFAYDGAAPVLLGVDFRIEANKVTSLVGESGAGKSTLVDLILKFRSPTQGAIWVDNQNLSNVHRPSWLRNVAVVRQDVFLFAGTMRENFLAWKVDATEEEILSACDRSGVLDLIEALPDGLDTIVGERGVTLSGGQRQRIALGRALLRNPQILILDEALSALDGETEAEVLDSLLSDSRRRTIIIISHRMTTVQSSDHIIVLDSGCVVEQGIHKELLTLHGRYRELFATQASQ